MREEKPSAWINCWECHILSYHQDQGPQCSHQGLQGVNLGIHSMKEYSGGVINPLRNFCAPQKVPM